MPMNSLDNFADLSCIEICPWELNLAVVCSGLLQSVTELHVHHRPLHSVSVLISFRFLLEQKSVLLCSDHLQVTLTLFVQPYVIHI